MTTVLKAEIKQQAPFGSLEEEVYLNLLRTEAVLEHAYADALKRFGLTQTQYNVLRILRGAGADGLCRNEVSARMIRPVPDTTRLLDRLEESGLVKRDRGDQDRRFVTARITKPGLDLLKKMDGPVKRMHEQRLGHLTRSELRLLADLLGKARAGL